jgi:hypothetical protein
VEPNSRAVLKTLSSVPNYAVFPILKKQTIKSERFKQRKRRHKADSEGELSESFSSGSAQNNEYVPRPTKRRM